MKHIKTFESFINEAVDIQDLSTVNTPAAVDAVAKGKNFEELKDIISQLLELARSDKKYYKPLYTLYYNYFIDQAIKTLIKPGMKFTPEQENRGSIYERMPRLFGRWTAGEGTATISTPEPELKNNDMVRFEEVIVDGVSRVNINVSIPVGYADGKRGRSTNITDTITWKNVKGIVSKRDFWYNVFLRTKEGQSLEKDVPIAEISKNS